MKEFKNTGKYTEKEWEDLSALLSGEENDNKELLIRFAEEDSHNTIKYWKEIREKMSEKEIDVDKAWNNLYSRLSENGLISETKVVKHRFVQSVYFRIAAVVLLMIGLGSVLLLVNDRDFLNRNTVVATTGNQKNLQVTLPDGSNVILNRNTTIKYSRNFNKHSRNIALTGEAFFEITPDPENPFTINAGNARIKVIGTSFNVKTDNDSSDVEVFVKTGKVMVSDNEGTRNMLLEPGFVGTMGQESKKYLNEDQNYMAWNSGILIYDGQTLSTVIRDLRKVYDMEVVADDPSILENTWTTNGPLDNQPQETIIRLICLSFNLSYSKDGNVFHLSKNN